MRAPTSFCWSEEKGTGYTEGTLEDWMYTCQGVSELINFDQQVLPTLTYAAEVWGVKEIQVAEHVHVYACKKILSVNPKTPNTMI